MNQSVEIAVLVLALSIAGVARAEGLEEGAKIPQFTARDLNGKQHTGAVWVSAPAVVVVMPSRDAKSETDAWVQRLEPHLADQSLVGLIAIDLPFFISDDLALRTAREAIPRKDWGRTLLAVEGEVRARLGLQSSSHPYVFVVNERGTVTLIVHGPPRSEAVRRVLAEWHAISGGRASAGSRGF